MSVGARQKLITSIVSTVLGETAQIDKRFDWFVNKHSKENFGKHFSVIDSIFIALNGDQEASTNKRLAPLVCDAYFGGKCNFIFEFDEFQHFTSARLQSLNLYPQKLKTNFSIEEWKMLCEQNKHKADRYRQAKRTVDFNFIGGRSSQRAYLDSFRDLLPEVHGLNPTLRISDLEVLDIVSDNKESSKRVEQLLKQRIT